MPLKIEFRSADDSHGYVIVDRNNLIIQFDPKSESSADIGAAVQKVNMLNRIISLYADPSFFMLTKSLDFMPQDLRHNLSDHHNTADANAHHVHFKFKQDVDFETVNTLFKSLPAYALSLCMLYEYRYRILHACKNYFDDLKQNKTSRMIESNYRQEKQAQLESAAPLFEKNQPLSFFKQPIVPMIRVDSHAELRKPACSHSN